MEVINDPNVEAVWICSPSQFHADQIKAAAKAGKHIFCEKPIATDLAGTIEAVQVRSVDRPWASVLLRLMLNRCRMSGTFIPFLFVVGCDHSISVERTRVVAVMVPISGEGARWNSAWRVWMCNSSEHGGLYRDEYQRALERVHTFRLRARTELGNRRHLFRRGVAYC